MQSSVSMGRRTQMGSCHRCGPSFRGSHTVFSTRLNRLFLLDTPWSLKKCFWACDATCVGVRVGTKYLETPLQFPFPSFFRPTRNAKCSDSVHGTPVDSRERHDDAPIQTSASVHGLSPWPYDRYCPLFIHLSDPHHPILSDRRVQFAFLSLPAAFGPILLSFVLPRAHTFPPTGLHAPGLGLGSCSSSFRPFLDLPFRQGCVCGPSIGRDPRGQLERGGCRHLVPFLLRSRCRARRLTRRGRMRQTWRPVLRVTRPLETHRPSENRGRKEGREGVEGRCEKERKGRWGRTGGPPRCVRYRV
eukprot:scaffold1368_cov333-Pavlova_lutheri.AAC.33